MRLGHRAEALVKRKSMRGLSAGREVAPKPCLSWRRKIQH
jgi:hypothetical protein